MLDRDTKGHLALGSALVDCLAVAGMTLPQAQAFFLVAMDEGPQRLGVRRARRRI